MPSVVFNCDFAPETLSAIGELRELRRGVLKQQMEEIGQTLQSLAEMGAVKPEERLSYQKTILGELRFKLAELEERLKEPDVIHSDELELYLELLAGDS